MNGIFQRCVEQREEQTFLAEKNISQEAVKCMDLFQLAYKLFRAKPCASTGAPWSVRKAAEDKTRKELPSSSCFNSLCLHNQQACSFSSKKLHKFKEVEIKQSYFLRIELITFFELGITPLSLI